MLHELSVALSVSEPDMSAPLNGIADHGFVPWERQLWFAVGLEAERDVELSEAP